MKRPSVIALLCRKSVVTAGGRKFCTCPGCLMRDYAATALAEVDQLSRVETPEEALCRQLINCALNELSSGQEMARDTGQLCFLFSGQPTFAHISPNRQETLMWFLSGDEEPTRSNPFPFLFIANALEFSSRTINKIRIEARTRALI